MTSKMSDSSTSGSVDAGFGRATQADCDVRAASGAQTRVWVRQIMGMPISVHALLMTPGVSTSQSGTATTGDETAQAVPFDQALHSDEALHGDVALHSDEVDAAVGNLFQELTWWDNTFSLWKSHSELSRLRDGHISVSETCPEMQAVMEWCSAAHTATGGLFCAELPAADRHQPTNVPVPGARRPVDVRFDPTGLVKGLAVEHAIAHVSHLPGLAVVVNAGGDLLTCSGQLTDHTPKSWTFRPVADAKPPTWQVGVSDPHHPGTIAAVINVPGDGMAVATSGGAERGDHIFDPLTCSWVDPAGSVTVIGPSLTWADVWATALCAGPANAMEQLTVWDNTYSAFRL